ncbi:MAG: type II toxin-antitoxin system VapC family toxin [Sphingomonas sp.]
MTVVDASLATKLLIKESDSEDARRWFGGQSEPVLAPDLLAIEVAQAVVRRVNARDVAAVRGRDILRTWRVILENDGIMLLRTSAAQVEKAAGLAISLGHPTKDCVYLALAIERNTNLMTCDAKFAARAREIYPGVKLLSDNAAD